MSDTLTMEGVVILSRTVPEESKKYGRRVCVVALWQELNCLVRVYPTEVTAPLKTGSVCRLRVCRNPLDSRGESYKLTDAVDGILDVGSKRLAMPDVGRMVLASAEVTTLDALNERRQSLGVLRAVQVKGSFADRQRGMAEDPKQRVLEFFEDVRQFDSRQTHVPYVSFTCAPSFASHRLQLREWGAHELIRKHPLKMSGLWKNLGFDGEQFLIVGNMAHQRTTWMILKTYPAAKVGMEVLNEQANRTGHG